MNKQDASDFDCGWIANINRFNVGEIHWNRCMTKYSINESKHSLRTGKDVKANWKVDKVFIHKPFLYSPSSILLIWRGIFEFEIWINWISFNNVNFVCLLKQNRLELRILYQVLHVNAADTKGSIGKYWKINSQQVIGNDSHFSFLTIHCHVKRTHSYHNDIYLSRSFN